MKHGQKPGEPRMEDVLASIRRAIDENATVSSDRFTRSVPEVRAKVDNPPNPPPGSKAARGLLIIPPSMAPDRISRRALPAYWVDVGRR